MSNIDDRLLRDAVRAVQEAQLAGKRYSNVGPAEVAVQMRRRLREVLDDAYSAGWRQGYSAAAMDESEGREAAAQAARDDKASKAQSAPASEGLA